MVYTNTHSQYDVAINDVPFFLAPSPTYPLIRDQHETARQQIDTSTEPGEQSLTSWWYRSQVSFHLGAGQAYYDPARGGADDQYRFWDSHGVDVWTKREVTLLPDTEWLYGPMTGGDWGPMKAYANASENGVIYGDGTALRRTEDDGTDTAITWGGSTDIKDVDLSPDYYWVIAAGGIYRGPIGFGSSGEKWFPCSPNMGRVAYAKGRLFAAVDSALYELLTVPVGIVSNKELTSNVVTLTTDRDHGLEVGQSIVVDDMGSPFDGEYTIASVPSTTTFTYSKTATDVASAAATGTIRCLPVDKTTQRGWCGSLLHDHPETGWVWSAIEAGQSAMFFAGYVGTSSSIYGHRSMIYASSLETANIDDDPQMTTPAVAAELPHGEYVLSMQTYADYLVVCTNKGVRVCLTQGEQIQLGPLSIETDGTCYDSAVWGNYVWVAGNRNEGLGLYRLDLGRKLDDGKFPYARDLVVTDITPGSNYVARVEMLGTTGRVAMMIKDGSSSGVWAAHATNVIQTSAWIQSSVLSFDTWEEKVFQSLRTMVGMQAGTITPQWIDLDDLSVNGLGAESTAAVRYIDKFGSDLDPRPMVAYRWVMDDASATAGPKFLGYQVKAFPANVSERSLKLPLACYLRERFKTGRTVERPVWDRIEAMEALERSQEVVGYQDFATGEVRNVQVENVQFVTDRPTQNRREAADPGGMLYVTLRTVS